MIDSGITIAAVIGVIVSPIIVGLWNYVLSRQQARQRQHERAEDWARQDLVAKRLEETAQRQAEIARRAEASAKIDRGQIIKSNLSIKSDIAEVHELAVTTHDLVNSALTEVMQAVLDGLIRELDLMRQVNASPEDIEMQEIKIAAKRAELGDRAKAAAQVIERSNP